MTEILYLDFEYNSSKERLLNVVCCSTLLSGEGSPLDWWLLEEKAPFIQYVKTKISEGFVICAHNLIADASALHSLGVDLRKPKFLDTMAEAIQWQNENNTAKYGKYYRNGEWGESKINSDNETHVGVGLSSMLYNIVGVTPNTEKDSMRNIIIRGAPFTEEEKEKILRYCSSDVIHLPALLMGLSIKIRTYAGTREGNKIKLLPKETYLQMAYNRGRWMANLAETERNGVPLNIERFKRIIARKDSIINHLKESISVNYFPFYTKVGKEWVQKYENLKRFIEEKGLQNVWDTTEEAGRYSASAEALGKFSDVYEEIKQLASTTKKVDALKSISSPFKKVAAKNKKTAKKKQKLDDRKMVHCIGYDGRLRFFANPYGSLTGRCQPSGAQCVFLMPSWMRCLIKPEKGKVIIGADFKSQEQLVAAMESGDKNMEACYDSGDAYVHFAKLAGVIPMEVPVKEAKEKYKHERNVFKQVSLSVQYGIGAPGLSAKLTRELRRPYTVTEARNLIALHKKIFSAYWSWNYAVIQDYRRREHMIMKDGWIIWGDMSTSTTVGNAPLQGGGQVVLRDSVERCFQKGLKVISTLHDAIYIESSCGVAKEHSSCLREYMEESFESFYGRKIGVDIKIHGYEDEWIEEKGEKDFEALKEYFMTPNELVSWELKKQASPDAEILL